MSSIERCMKLCEAVDKFCEYAAQVEACEPWEEERHPASCAADSVVRLLARFLCQK